MTDAYDTTDLNATVDLPRLTQWLDDNAPEIGSGKLTVNMIHGGTSNIILSVNRGGYTVVLRCTPPSPPPGSQQAIEREATLLSALNGSSVPRPHVYGKCVDPAVMNASFYVMEKVDGWAPELNNRDTQFQPPFNQAKHKPGLAYAMVDGLIELAKVDYLAVGLENFGKPEGFLQRQVNRWGKQLDSYKSRYKNYQGRDIPGLDIVAQWLRDNIPVNTEPAIIHGDYGFPNVMFCHNTPPRLAAMIDWELATIGDPMMDIGWFLNSFRDERAPTEVPYSSYFDPTDFPTRQTLAAHYAKGTGRDISHLDYYMVLALYKGACICEYKVAAAMDGLIPQDVGEMFTQFVLDNTKEAEKITRWSS